MTQPAPGFPPPNQGAPVGHGAPPRMGPPENPPVVRPTPDSGRLPDRPGRGEDKKDKKKDKDDDKKDDKRDDKKDDRRPRPPGR